MKNWINLLRDKIYLLIFLGLVILFFYPFIFKGEIPIPADTIVGMYHPWRDVVWNHYSTGVPFKNFLITDPVRQQYVWRELAIEQLRKGKLPLWNPYSFSGTLLLANFQTGAFYPLNILFFILPFNFAWGFLVLLQPLLAGMFLYLYLRSINVGKWGSFLGAITFSFSGFSIAWLEWNTIGHTILWLPLILLSIEKVIQYIQEISNIKYKKIILWSSILVISLISSFFAGHLQIFFYCFLFLLTYLIIKVLTLSRNKVKTILFFVICFLLFVIITSIQWMPTLQFILLSARDFDQGSWLKPGWFIPWQNLIQFLAPDFFGNPATGNYWGVWNYGEFVGYIGLIPLILAFYSLLFRRDKKSLFFALIVFFSLIFALPTSLAKLPYQWQLPLISTSQPTRLLSLVDFSLAILAALGLDYLLKDKSSMVRAIRLLFCVGFIYGILWFFVSGGWQFSPFVIEKTNITVAGRNLILPTILFLLASFGLVVYLFLLKRKRFQRFSIIVIYCLLLLTIFDLFRFGWKFTPFSREEWIFPKTNLISTVEKDSGISRFLSLDRRIMPPNFSNYYRIQDISGYDPLYLQHFGQFVASWERGKPDISPASFNRIITPANFRSVFLDLLGVKYILSLDPILSNNMELINMEGKTYLYRNKNVFPRAFFAEKILLAESLQDEIEKMFILGDKLKYIATTGENLRLPQVKLSRGEYVEIRQYDNNYVQVATKSEIERLLVLTDIYYPSWQVFIDGKKGKVLRVDFTFRGVVVPAGEHIVEFKIGLL